MIEGIPIGGTIGIGSGWLIVFIGVVMIFRGALVTRREVEDKNKMIDKLIEANKEQGAQISLLMNSAIPTVDAVLTALHRAAGDDAP